MPFFWTTVYVGSLAKVKRGNLFSDIDFVAAVKSWSSLETPTAPSIGMAARKDNFIFFIEN